MKNIGIIGNGFVGSALDHGLSTVHRTYVYDANPERSKDTLDIIISKCSVIFLCLPTPSNSDGSIDLSYIRTFFDTIKHKETDSIIFAMKSTVVPGTCDILSKEYGVSIVSNPEFLTERVAKEDFMNPRAVVIGGDSNNCHVVKEVYHDLYEPLRLCEVGGIKGVDYIITGTREAEFIKYCTNCFFASKVSLMNEFYNICSELSIDYNEVVRGILADGRIFPMHTDVPGPDGKRGFGGRCFPKDINAICSLARDNNIDVSILEEVIRKNSLIRNISD